MVRILNLDSGYIPIPYPEIEFKLSKFPGGELQIRLNSRINYSVVETVIITQRVRNSDDLIAILLAANALRELGVEDLELILPYFPYGRQDRVCYPGEAFSLKVATDLINSCEFKTVYTVDNHSGVTQELLHHNVDSSSFDIVLRALKPFKNQFVLVAPDKGAKEKVNTLALFFNVPMVSCDKVRDPDSGRITSISVSDGDLTGKHCIVVDDLCDGGSTFLMVGKALKERGCGSLKLYVTHGIFSNGLEELLEIYDEIYTTNSFQDIDHPQVKIFQTY